MSKLEPIVKTLFLGIEAFVPQRDRAVFLRAIHGADWRDFPEAKHWKIEQGFAPYADRLKEAGYDAQPSLTLAPDSADAVFLLASRFAEENKHLLARAWQALETGGWLVIAQHNDLGAKRLDGLVKQLGGEVVTLTKHHCRAIASRKPQGVVAPTEWLKILAPVAVPETPLYAAPGMFSWRQVDSGSALLMEALPQGLTGKGADIAAGWGYLSWRLLESNPGIASISLYEAEKAALDMAQRNLPAEKVALHWCDAARSLPETPAGGFDWAVMNPPAHDLFWHAPEMTAAMFRQAAEALKKGGVMWLVAGRQLPYEALLGELFTSVVKLREDREFKVLEVRK